MNVTTMPAGEFKTHCLQVMETVRRRRETVVITKRGVPVAKLVPVDLPQPHKIFGCLVGRGEEVGDIVSPVLPPEAWDALK
ncbi:MAG TPA: type II toxin-antitoxin system Phd/YefM family antitoxin [Thermoanaerobaculia bacterium]|jgi:prevent-host-death family protein